MCKLSTEKPSIFDQYDVTAWQIYDSVVITLPFVFPMQNISLSTINLYHFDVDAIVNILL
jgi:hypothetical protein